MTHTTAINYCAAGRFQRAWVGRTELWRLLSEVWYLSSDEASFGQRLEGVLLQQSLKHAKWSLCDAPQHGDDTVTVILHDNGTDWTLLVGEHAYGAACAKHAAGEVERVIHEEAVPAVAAVNDNKDEVQHEQTRET